MLTRLQCRLDSNSFYLAYQSNTLSDTERVTQWGTRWGTVRPSETDKLKLCQFRPYAGQQPERARFYVIKNIKMA